MVLFSWVSEKVIWGVVGFGWMGWVEAWDDGTVEFGVGGGCEVWD